MRRKASWVLLMASVFVIPSAWANASAKKVDAANGQPWVIQLGYFASLDNALALQQLVGDAGYEAEVITTGLPGEQRYRVITGQADERDALIELRDEIAARTGHKGLINPSPMDDGRVRVVSGEDPFEEAHSRELFAQVGPSNTSTSPMRAATYNPLTPTPQEEIDDMAGFSAGGVYIIPTLGASLGYDNNLTRSNIDEDESWFYMVSPAIRAEMPTDHAVVGLMAAANWVWYTDSSIDDYDSWIVSADWQWDVSTRQDLGLFANYTEDVDPRGTGRRQGDAGLIPLEPDAWERFSYGGTWDYGAAGSRGRLSVLAGASNLNYTNNRGNGTPQDPGTTELDRDWWYLGGTYFWRVAPKTSLLLDYLYTDMSYDTATQSDSTIHSWMLGVEWDATARTSGTLQYGIQKRRFEDESQDDYDGPAWLATVNWQPRTYSLFTLTGSRSTQEPDGGGAYVLRQDVVLSWLHEWATRFSSTVDLGYGQDDYRPNGRTDDLWYWGIGAQYVFNQHFQFGASVTGYDRNSDVEQYNYQRMVYLLTLEASF